MSRLVLTDANVLDGANPRQPGKTVVVSGDRITAVLDGAPTREPGDRIVDLRGRTVMPGMFTCHFHSTYHNLEVPAPYGNGYPPAYQALICRRNLLLALAAGYTGVVGAGGANEVEAGVKQALADGFIRGPRFVPSGREISTTGHSNDSTPWHWGMPRTGAAHICDGPDSFRLGVRDEVKKGAEVIKLFVTGGHGTRPPKDRMEMTRDELAAAIETAHSRGVLIRGHIAGKHAIMTAVELGIDIVDHCDDMDDEVIAALLETGTFVVPSVLFPKVTAARLDAVRPEAAAEMRADLVSFYEVLRQADEAGVKLLLGDDFGAPGMEHGQYGEELHTYVEDAGIAPLSVLRWGTRNGADLVGRAADLGTIAAGAIADLVVVDGDPSDDIGLLADKAPVAVMVGGEVLVGHLPGETTA